MFVIPDPGTPVITLTGICFTQITSLRMILLDTQLNLPSDTKHVEQVQPFVDELAQRYKLNAETHGNMVLTLTEAVTNAMLHGNRGDRSKLVSISLRHDSGSLAVQVSDQGPGFDPCAVPDPTCKARVEECGGRGIHIMRLLSDECNFIRNGSTVEMRFKI